MRTFLSLLLVLVFAAMTLGLSVETGCAQTTTRLRGLVVDDEDGRPIASATVLVAGTSYRVATDAYGRFQLDNLPVGECRIDVRAVGYQPVTSENVRISEDLVQWREFRLMVTPPDVGIISVTAEAPMSTTSDLTVIDRHTIERQHPQNVTELLERVPGVDVQKDGSASGEARVSIRGSASRHVLVLVDGHPINASATGEADLNSVPVKAIDRVEIHKGGASAQFGPNALGGVINIVTQPSGERLEREASYEASSGKWKAQAQSFSAINPVAVCGLASTVSYDECASNGDYHFSNRVEPGETYDGVRINNHSTRINYHLAGDYRWGSRTSVSFSGQQFKAERGLPGLARSQNATAEAEDDRLLLDLSLRRRNGDRLQTDLSLSFSRFKQHFNDTSLAGRPPQVDSEYGNKIIKAAMHAIWRPMAGNTASLMFQANSERLDHRDLLREVNSMGHTRRTDFGLALSCLQEVRLSPRLGGVRAAVEGSLRRDEVTTGNDRAEAASDSTTQNAGYWSNAVGASVAAGTALRVTVRGRYGKSLNLPSMNALFWKGDARSEGNPDLLPERTEHSEGSVELQWCDSKAVAVSVSGTYFHTSYRDLVQWQSDFRGVWKPYNLAGALITGHEDAVTLGLFDRLVELEYQNTVTTALNREPGLNSYGKMVRYTPQYQTLVTVRFDLNWWWAAYDIRWVGQRYLLVNNEKASEAYRVDDLKSGVRIKYRHFAAELSYASQNLRGENYAIITHYPMPPRQWQVGFAVAYSGNPQ